MGWEDLLAPNEDLRILPWTGGREIADQGRVWKVAGALPLAQGWYEFEVSGGRRATLRGPAEPDLDGFERGHEQTRGYLVGNRLIPDDVRVDPDPAKLVQQTEPVFLVEPGLERFSRALTARAGTGELIYLRQEFPEGPEVEVLEAYQDRAESVAHVTGVTPALDLAFRWISYQRWLAEERQRQQERQRQLQLAEEERARAAEERQRQAREHVGTGLGRRVLAATDFEAAARAALAISGAELLDSRASRNRREMVVQYRFRLHRLECVVERHTLRVVDAGVCLQDHETGEKGDRHLTLESLPPVVGQAIDEDRLVVWRHA